MTEPHDAAPPGPPVSPPDEPPRPQLRRSKRQKVLGGVCGGLGRQFDLDPVIFRIVLGVLTVTGGIGLIFYGFAWLFLPLDDEEESEARRLLTGRVDGTTLVAVLCALIGCGLFLSMLNNGTVLGFAVLLSVALTGATYWSQRRRLADPQSGPLDPVAAQAVKVAPPETKAPPVQGPPSWWRDPIVKDGTTGLPGSGYMWGPEAAIVDDALARARAKVSGGAPQPRRRDPATRGPRGIGGRVFLLAVLAGGLGTALSWEGRPLGTSLQIGLACALAVFGLGIAVSSLLGRTGVGSILLAVITAGLLAASAMLPKDISTQWMRTDWTPTSVAAVQPRYELGSGVGTLDLGAVRVPVDQEVSTGAEVGAGRLLVVVPKDVTVKVSIDVGLGDIRLPSDGPQDVDVQPGQRIRQTLKPPKGAKPAGTVELRLEMGAGQVEVARAAK